MAVGSPPFPDGLGDGHARLRGLHRRHASVLSLLLLGAILVAALLGLFGGGKASERSVTTPAASLSVKTPLVLRSGVFFETHVRVIARTPIAKPTLAIPPSLWRDQTINSNIPAASEEGFKDGSFRLEYPALKAGEALEVKIDGQINPPLTLGVSGTVALLDGDAPVAALPLAIRVLP